MICERQLYLQKAGLVRELLCVSNVGLVITLLGQFCAFSSSGWINTEMFLGRWLVIVCELLKYNNYRRYMF